MRFLVLIAGLLGAAGAATAGELHAPHEHSDAAAGRLIYEARFGAEGPALASSSFQLRLGSDAQIQTGQRPALVAEYRPATASVLLNGLDVAPMLVARQNEEGFFASTIGGWVPLLIVLTAATFILVDGNDQPVVDPDATGSTN